jgi:hypothetical protein
VDWLIYHCPLKDSGLDEGPPFKVKYYPDGYFGAYTCFGITPFHIYKELAFALVRDPNIHREITDLYWYWTI